MFLDCRIDAHSFIITYMTLKNISEKSSTYWQPIKEFDYNKHNKKFNNKIIDILQ